jgi:hypothetical protein
MIDREGEKDAHMHQVYRLSEIGTYSHERFGFWWKQGKVGVILDAHQQGEQQRPALHVVLVQLGPSVALLGHA